MPLQAPHLLSTLPCLVCFIFARGSLSGPSALILGRIRHSWISNPPEPLLFPAYLSLVQDPADGQAGHERQASALRSLAGGHHRFTLLVSAGDLVSGRRLRAGVTVADANSRRIIKCAGPCFGSYASRKQRAFMPVFSKAAWIFSLNLFHRRWT